MTKPWTRNPCHEAVTAEGEEESLPRVDDEYRYALYDTVKIRLTSTPSPPTLQQNEDDELLDNDDDDRDRTHCKSSITVLCVRELTPLDMLDLSNGTGDATGQQVWIGALFFIESFCVSRKRRRRPSRGGGSIVHDIFMHLEHWKELLFRGKNVLELGCGTGVCGIALLRQLQEKEKEEQQNLPKNMTTNNNNSKGGEHKDGQCNQVDFSENEIVFTQRCCPAHVTFTDGSVDALDLCRRNCTENGLIDDDAKARKAGPRREETNSHSSYSSCSVQSLRWEDTIKNDSGCVDHHTAGAAVLDPFTARRRQSSFQNDGSVRCSLQYDTVIATDVVYDLSILPDLFRAASSALHRHNNNERRENGNGGYFVLSHVPRASLGCDAEENNASSTAGACSAKELERRINQQAKRAGMELISTIRPEDVSQAYGADGLVNRKYLMGSSRRYFSWKDIADVGASLLIYRHCRS